MVLVMIGRLHTVVIDCPNPAALAEFYSALLGLPITRRDSDWVTIGGDGWPRIAFQLAPDLQEPAWPDPEQPQQVHLDVQVDDIDAAEQRVLALGATRLRSDESGFRVYADPAEHPFCLEFDP
jgi:catechol 2,3-dioxygenase-like lactoylglutathione lyase family enzyme